MKWGDAHISHGSRACGSRGMFLLVVLVLCVFPQRLLSQDTINRDEPDFVKVSLLLAEPGGALYSRFGHACLRMQCPTFDMDFAFTYESEDASSRVLRFMAGKLKMGLFGIPTQDYLACYAQEGRGVKEYPLDMPIAAKRNLWRVLDSYTSDGINIPYNYITRGCAYSTLRFLREGLDTIPIEFGLWPEKYETMTRREIAELQMEDSPWCWAFMNLICNGVIDKECSKMDKIIMPCDLLEVLQHAKVQGHPLLTGECITLLPDGPGLHAPHGLAAAAGAHAGGRFLALAVDGLRAAGHSDPVGLGKPLSGVLLHAVLHRVELAHHPLQPAAAAVLEMAPPLGLAHGHRARRLVHRRRLLATPPHRPLLYHTDPLADNELHYDIFQNKTNQ